MLPGFRLMVRPLAIGVRKTSSLNYVIFNFRLKVSWTNIPVITMKKRIFSWLLKISIVPIYTIPSNKLISCMAGKFEYNVAVIDRIWVLGLGNRTTEPLAAPELSTMEKLCKRKALVRSGTVVKLFPSRCNSSIVVRLDTNVIESSFKLLPVRSR